MAAVVGGVVAEARGMMGAVTVVFGGVANVIAVGAAAV